MDAQNGFSFSLALNGAVYIMLTLICIGLAWWGLQQFRFDLFLRNPRSLPARLLMLFIAVALGYTVASFFISYFNWTLMFKGMF